MILSSVLLYILISSLYKHSNEEYLKKNSEETGYSLTILWYTIYIQMVATICITLGLWFPYLTKIGSVILLPNWLIVVYVFWGSSDRNYYLTVLAITLYLALA